MSWTSLVAVVASGLLVAGPLAGGGAAPDLVEFCTNDRLQADEAGTFNMDRIFIGTGVVVAAEPGERLLTVKHRNITGIMGAMTMMFRVDSPSLVQDLRPNDEVRFKIAGSTMTIVAIGLLPPAK